MLQSNLPINYSERREQVFLVLAGIFLAAMVLLNVIGVTNFIQLGRLSLAVGVLSYPLTFLCTDLISELYGKKRASFLVWVGLGLNCFVLFIMFLGQWLPSVEGVGQPPWQVVTLANPVTFPNGETLEGDVPLFAMLYACAAGSMLGSMLAYVTAQFCDVHIYHFLKKLTGGRYLWLRNNGSTLCSQLVDSVTVVVVVFGVSFYKGEMGFDAIFTILLSNYAFKVVAALVDTIPFYFAVNYLKTYMGLTSDTTISPELGDIC